MAHKDLPARALVPLFLLLLLLSPGALLTTARAQQQPQGPAAQDDEVIRISTELVQTDVTVFDKQGRFVDDLKPEQFELRVDGKPVQISFFDKITAGTPEEEARLAAARSRSGGAFAGASATATAPKPPDRGRIIFFFLDDTHLAADSVARVRKTLLEFIDKEMGQNDQVAIAAATGQLGFLQQLTDNKVVLRAAVERLTFRPFDVHDSERPQMSVYQAVEINERSNLQLLNFFVEQLQQELPQMPRDRLEQMVKDRANLLIQQSAAVTTNLLASLESLARSAGPLPGRKLVFFISDGFFLTTRVSNVPEKLRRITDAAARTGVVIYSIDARGLVTGMPDASQPTPADPSGIVVTTGLHEVTASQEPLRTLAADTGGRALLNSNSLGRGVETALRETSAYYLLAWRPEGEAKGGGKFRRIEASIKGRPELTVRVRRGFFDVEPPPAATAARNKPDQNKGAQAASPEEEGLRKALGSMYPKTDLPTSLTVSYMDVQNVGPVVTAMMQVGGESLEKEGGASAPAVVDVAGVLFDAEGKPVSSFRNRLSATASAGTSGTAAGGSAPVPRQRVVYTNQFRAAPGLYQVRVSARDARSGRAGSAMQWIEIPDLAQHKLSLSSLMLGEAMQDAGAQGAGKAEPTAAARSMLSADRRFAHTSKLRFLTFIYNAARGQDASSAAPDVAVQVQVLRDDKPVLTTALRKVIPGPDLARLPYAAELPLEGLPPGRYELKITAIDRLGKSAASQQAAFEIE